MKILIVTDAWYPQINGVVRSIDQTAKSLRAQGFEVMVLAPDAFFTLPLPSYPEIRLAFFWPGQVARIIERLKPVSIHIATEGPLGLAARRCCLRNDWQFTTALHTKFPEYLNKRIKTPVRWGYAFLRWFHQKAAATLVTTRTQQQELEKHGFTNTQIWSRGVDIQQFSAQGLSYAGFDDSWPRPWLLNVGRVAVEKNLEAFLKIKRPGTKIVVGAGPALKTLQAKYPEVKFIGALQGQALSAAYRSCDLFVFPSLTDTFGLVIVEALASGLPVAAYPVTGPIDILDAHAGVMDQDLGKAIDQALSIDSDAAQALAQKFSWQACTERFKENLITLSGQPVALQNNKVDT